MVKQLSPMTSESLTAQLSVINPNCWGKRSFSAGCIESRIRPRYMHSSSFSLRGESVVFREMCEKREWEKTQQRDRRRFFWSESWTLTCPGLELSHTMTSSSVAISGGLSFTSSTWTVTGTWLRRLGLSGAERKQATKKRKVKCKP